MLFGIAFRTSASGQLSSQNHFLGRAMHHGCVAAANVGAPKLGPTWAQRMQLAITDGLSGVTPDRLAP
jgi:hypothetical protein